MDFSQHGEQPIILKYFNGQLNGRLLDVGAFDGKTFSNTYALVKDYGWSGVMVEPNPSSLRSLIELYRDNPLIQLVSAVIVPQAEQFVEFFSCDDAVSTSDPTMAAMWNKTPFRKVIMPGIKAEDFAARFAGPYDFVSLDVEDNTLAIAKGMTSIWNVTKLVCIEHTVGHTSVKVEMHRFFTMEMGFKLLADIQENFIFAR